MAEQPQSVPKAVLYHFCPGSVWSSVPVLTALEKGFTETQLEKRYVNLLEGQNFSPSFLRISPSGTVPALIVPYEHTLTSSLPTKFKALLSTTSICDFLDASTLPSSHSAPTLSPATVQGNVDSRTLIELLHGEKAPDPNFLLMSFRNEAERKAKLAGIPGKFLKGRQEALEGFREEVKDGGDERLKMFYENKIGENGTLLGMYEGRVESGGFEEKSRKGWEELEVTLKKVEGILEGSNGMYAIGDQISLADMHLAAYLARILAIAAPGSSPATLGSAIPALEANLPSGTKVGVALKKYLENLVERDSVKDVYSAGFH